MKHAHDMPFGATPEAEGVRFRLWAPAARAVALCLEGPAVRTVAMQRQGDGWHEIHVLGAGEGTRYRYLIDNEIMAPDPASRFQPEDVAGPSQVIDPRAFDWTDTGWQGRPWHEAVVYELHVGAFSPAGTFAGVKQRLDYLADLGVTAIELMPVADFPGECNWGYDGVLAFAPDSRYGNPAELKDLVQAAHARGLMVFLDVVYNHFGPEGNYLYRYAPQFFNSERHTPWGAAINFDGPMCRQVRDFFIHNALYWLEEYHMDGLRLDAVHAIIDQSHPDILDELTEAVRNGPGATRHVHLVLENDHNAARYLKHDAGGRPVAFAAQWNDDIHHSLHVLITGEHRGYYADYADDAARHLRRCLTEGFAYQGETSPYRRGSRRGESTSGIPLTAFVSFLQNHDQIGNRAFGERIGELAPPAAVRAAMAILLLAPSPPLLFMGQEWNAHEPFPYFCAYGGDLARAVTEGRRREFAGFPEFSDPKARSSIPDPNDPKTYQSAVLDWERARQPDAQGWFRFYRDLLSLRARHIVPRLPGMPGGTAEATRLTARALQARWRLGDGSQLRLTANLSPELVTGVKLPEGRSLYPEAAIAGDALPPWFVSWRLVSDRE